MHLDVNGYKYSLIYSDKIICIIKIMIYTWSARVYIIIITLMKTQLLFEEFDVGNFIDISTIKSNN